MKGLEYDRKTLNDLTTIPPHRRRPLRFSWRLTAFCYALSFATHASMVVGLVFTPGRAAAPRSAQAGDMPAGERRPVAIAMMQVRMSDFAQPGQSKPSARVAPPSDTAPSDTSGASVDKPRVEPVAKDAQDAPDLTADQQAASSHERTPAPKPDARAQSPTDSDKTEPPAESPDERLAQRDEPERAPKPDPETPVPTPAAPSPTPEARAASDRDAQAAEALRDKLVKLDPMPTSNASPTVPPMPRPIERDNPLSRPAPPRDVGAETQTATKIATETADPAAEPIQTASPNNPPGEPEQSPQSAEPDPPTTAAAESAKPTQTPKNASATEHDMPDPKAKAYDEDSVDQRVEFKKKVVPKKSYKSEKFGDTGTIRILVEIDVDGTLVRHTVLEGEDQPRLLAAALKALRGSTFLPAEREGEPVRSTRMIEYRF
ncbi:MAG: energy transducer TonB [Phycisphaeraceae bacterium]